MTIDLNSSGWSAGPRSLAVFDAEAEHMAPGTQGFALFSRICMDHGQGAVLHDVDGNRYVDLMAGIGVASLGYAHPRWVAAMQRQVARIHVGSFTSESRARLVALLAQLAPGDVNRTQLYSSGAEAVESALRLARAHTGRHEVVGFWGGFHGKTGGVLPLLSSTFKHGHGPFAPGLYSAPYAAAGRCVMQSGPHDCTAHCIAFLRRKIELETANDVAAILVEPIQGTAGNVVPDAGFLRALRALADEIGALLICDEMITGFGRTGTMFAVEHEGVVPDIMTVGKGFGGGFPMSGVLVREPLAWAEPWSKPSGSSSSYGGNPLACAAALATLETIQEEGLVEHSRRLGGQMLREMERWERDLPIVRGVRGRGMMIGMDLVDPGTGALLDRGTTRWIFDRLLSRGVLSMIYAPEVRINPPLVITEEQAMGALEQMRQVLAEVADHLSGAPAGAAAAPAMAGA